MGDSRLAVTTFEFLDLLLEPLCLSSSCASDSLCSLFHQIRIVCIRCHAIFYPRKQHAAICADFFHIEKQILSIGSAPHPASSLNHIKNPLPNALLYACMGKGVRPLTSPFFYIGPLAMPPFLLILDKTGDH